MQWKERVPGDEGQRELGPEAEAGKEGSPLVKSSWDLMVVMEETDETVASPLE